MTLWFPVMVNDEKIGEVHIKRRAEGQHDPGPMGGGYYTYDYEIHMPEERGGMRRGVTHHRAWMGPLCLIMDALKQDGWVPPTRPGPKPPQTDG